MLAEFTMVVQQCLDGELVVAGIGTGVHRVGTLGIGLPGRGVDDIGGNEIALLVVIEVPRTRYAGSEAMGEVEFHIGGTEDADHVLVVVGLLHLLDWRNGRVGPGIDGIWVGS